MDPCLYILWRLYVIVMVPIFVDDPNWPNVGVVGTKCDLGPILVNNSTDPNVDVTIARTISNLAY